MLLLVPLLLTAAPFAEPAAASVPAAPTAPTAATAATAATATLRVVALPLRDDGAGPELTNTATSLTAVALSRVAGFDVLSGDDVKAAADVEAQRQMLGCDESGCLAEIAEALGADRLVHGSVARLGGTVVVTLSFFDARSSVALGREVVQAGDDSALPAEIERAVARLTGATRGSSSSSSSSSSTGTWLLVGGAAGTLAGGVLAATGSLLSLEARGVLGNQTSSGADKSDALAARPLWSGLAVGGLALAVVGLGVAGAGLVVE